MIGDREVSDWPGMRKLGAMDPYCAPDGSQHVDTTSMSISMLICNLAQYVYCMWSRRRGSEILPIGQACVTWGSRSWDVPWTARHVDMNVDCCVTCAHR